MRVDLFDYELPDELIAQTPAPAREAARLMVVRGDGETQLAHRTIADLDSLVPDDALIVVNDTRVRHARLIGKKDSGGRAEIFLLRPLPSGKWEAMGRASKPFRFPSEIAIVDADDKPTPLVAKLVRRIEGAQIEIELVLASGSSASIDDAIDRYGRVPLPPYIKREPDRSDADRYQTVFSKELGAVAAPTAGLHLSQALLERWKDRLVAITLHVGLGTFQPVTAADLDAHAMHSETFSIAPDVAKRIDAARATGRPIVAIGTTVVRALESHAAGLSGETRLLIQPGYRFRAVDVLLTNFHLPKSTLLALVSAFGGRERILAAYAEAVRERYRFFSYGDAMLVWPPT